MKPPGVKFFKTLYRIGLGPIVGRLILILTTTGRKTGLPRETALQYEQVGDDIYLGSSRGTRADWVRNIAANSQVSFRSSRGEFRAKAEIVTDPLRIVDFIELRLERHPRMVGMILKSEGLSSSPTRAELEVYANDLAVVILHPLPEVGVR